MKAYGLVFLMLVLVAAASFVTFAQESPADTAATRPATSTSPSTSTATQPRTVDLGSWADMIEVAKLTAQQQEKLRQRVGEQQQAIAAFWQEARPKMADLRKALGEAMEKKDATAQAMAQEQLLDINKKYQALSAQKLANIMAILEREQLAAWHSYGLERSISMRYSRLTLSDEQTKKMKTIFDDFGKQMADAKDPLDYKAQSEIYQKIADKIDKDVLTDEQRSQMKMVRPTM